MGTKFRIPVSSTHMNKQWNAVLSEINGDSVKIEVSFGECESCLTFTYLISYLHIS